MYNLEIIKQASVELQELDSKQVVKVAGVLRKIRNWFKGLGNPEFREKLVNLKNESVQVRSRLINLDKKLKEIDTSIEDGDIERYKNLLDDIKLLATELSKELGEVTESATEAQQSVTYPTPEPAPTNVVVGPGIFPPGILEVGDVLGDVRYGSKFTNSEPILNRFIVSIVKAGISKERASKSVLNINFFNLLREAVSAGKVTRREYSRNKGFEGQYLYEVLSVPFEIPELQVQMTVNMEVSENKYLKKNPTPIRTIKFPKEIRVTSVAPVQDEEDDFPPDYGDLDYGDPRDDCSDCVSTAARRNFLNKLVNKTAATTDIWWKDSVQEQKGSSLPDSFWVKFVEMCKRLGVGPYELAIVINGESGFNAAARNFAAGPNKPPVAQGLNQFIKNTAIKGFGMSENLWMQFYKLSAEEQLPWVEKYFKGKAKGKNAGDLYLMNFGGYKNPDGSIYASKAAQKAFKKRHPDAVFQNPDYQQKAIEQNPGLVDDFGRIMPDKIKQSTKRSLPSGIFQKIKQAVQVTAGQDPPPFEEPNPQGPNTLEYRFGDDDTYEDYEDYEEEMGEQDLRKEVAELSQVLGINLASRKMTQMVVNAIGKELLPHNKISIKIKASDIPTGTEYAYVLSNAIARTTDSDVDVCGDGNNIEVVCDVVGSKDAIIDALDEIDGFVAKAFQDKYKQPVISVIKVGESKLPILSETKIERERRKFNLKRI